MKAITYILQNATDVTDLLTAPKTTGATAADAIYVGHALQDQEPAYITIESTVIDNYVVKEQSRSLIKESYEIFIYERGYAAARTIAEKVEAALDNKASAYYNNQYLSSCKLVDEDSLNDVEENNDYWLVTQTYEAVLEATTTSYTAISAFTYSNNNQTVSGAITAMAASVTGDVNTYKIADSDTSNYTASGLSLNASTGAITGTLAASCDFEVLAVGKDGRTIGAENVTHTFSAAGSDIDDVVTAANIKGWWRMSDGRTDDGTVISQVNGKHTGAENLVQTTENDKPILSDINGKSAALFNDDKFDCILASDVTQPCHLFYVLHLMPTDVAHFYGADTSFRFYLQNTQLAFQISGTTETSTLSNSEYSDSFKTPSILELYFDGVGNVTIRVNGGESYSATETASSTANIPLATNWSLGSRYNSASVNCGGLIGEHIIYQGTLTTDERQDIEGVLAHLWWEDQGYTNRLAAGHPHKTTRP